MRASLVTLALLLAATQAWSQRPPAGERVIAQQFRDATVPLAARRGLDWATVSTQAEPQRLVVRAQQCEGSRCATWSAAVLVARPPRPGSVFVRDLSFGPGWLVVEVEDGEVVHQYFYAPLPSGLTRVLDVVIRDRAVASASVVWRPGPREVEVTTERRSLPPREGWPPPPLQRAVYRWDAPELVETRRE